MMRSLVIATEKLIQVIGTATGQILGLCRGLPQTPRGVKHFIPQQGNNKQITDATVRMNDRLAMSKIGKWCRL
jgi:hypothetical protein